MLLRASSVLVNQTKSRASVVAKSKKGQGLNPGGQNGTSPGFSKTLNLGKQPSIFSESEMANCSVDEEESNIGAIIGMSVHRCSMIKKYSMETFFTPAKGGHKRAATHEMQPAEVFKADFKPVDSAHPSMHDVSVNPGDQTQLGNRSQISKCSSY